MKRKLLVLSILASSMSFAQDCSELFISEYVEGWSNNKALEIYNPTDVSIDLSQYMVVRYSNGSATATAANAVQLTGTIGANDVHVGVIEKLDPQGTGQETPVWDDLQAKADAFYCPDYNTSNAFYWNGNDAIILYRGTIGDIPGAVIVDVFGKLGEDPGSAWTADFPYVGTGDEVTKDHSMIRKSSILTGQTNPLPSYFDPLADWDSIPPVVTIDDTLYGNWESLGVHDCACDQGGVDALSIHDVTVYPNPTNDGVIYLDNASAIESVEIVNALGQTIKTINGNSNSLVKVSIDDSKGLFILKLIDNKGNSLTKRVIVK